MPRSSKEKSSKMAGKKKVFALVKCQQYNISDWFVK